MKYHNKTPLRQVGKIPSAGAEQYGEKTAVVHRGNERSYAGMEARANRIANALADSGVDRDDRVGIYMESNVDWMAALFGIIKTGAIAVPLNFRRAPSGTAYVIDDAGIEVLIGSSHFGDVFEHLLEDSPLSAAYVLNGGSDGAFEDLDEWCGDQPSTFDGPDRSFDDVAVQCYTSGTTGDPKGVLTTHRNVLTTLNSFDKRGGTDPETEARVTIAPLFHMMGLTTMFSALYTGVKTIQKSTPEPATLLEAITEHEATSFSAVPSIYIGMVEKLEATPEAYDISSITSLGTGAAPLPDDTRRRIESTFDVPLVEGWGMTETTAAGATNAPSGVQKGAGCVGQPLPDLEWKLVDPVTRETRVPLGHLDPSKPATLTGYEPDFDDESTHLGEIAVRGPQVFAGYHELPEKTDAAFDEEGWFYTKDIARVDEDRFLWMVDRVDDMIVVGGENVYPGEVENPLFRHPEIRENAVVAAPHERKGEAPVAYVVTTDDATVSEEEIRKYALDHVPTYAHPRRVFFVDELPRSGTQKVQRYKLEERTKAELDEPLESSERL